MSFHNLIAPILFCVAFASSSSASGLPGCKDVKACAMSFGCDSYNPGVGNPKGGFPFCGDMVVWDVCKLASDGTGTCSAATDNVCESSACYKDVDGQSMCAGGRFSCEPNGADVKLTPAICPCLDVIPPLGPRRPINARFCNGSAVTQQWQRDGDTFRSKAVNGSCLSVDMTVAPCDGSASQKWELGDDGLLKSSGKLLRYHTDIATAYCDIGDCPSANPAYDRTGFVYPDGWHFSAEESSWDLFPTRFWVFRDGYIMSQVLSSLMGSMQCSPKHWPPLPLPADIHGQPGGISTPTINSVLV